MFGTARWSWSRHRTSRRRFLPRLWALVQWPVLGVVAATVVYNGLCALPGDAVGVGSKDSTRDWPNSVAVNSAWTALVLVQFWSWLTHALAATWGRRRRAATP